MDASIHPNYSINTWIYISYLATDAIPRVSRFKIKDNTVSQFETIFETSTPGYYGNGMRIAWQDDNHFFLNIGGTTLSTNSNSDLIAQDLNKDWGKYIDYMKMAVLLLIILYSMDRQDHQQYGAMVIEIHRDSIMIN